jgi:two-component system, cell cycle sensor histidine kinase and response regulator CckA
MKMAEMLKWLLPTPVVHPHGIWSASKTMAGSLFLGCFGWMLAAWSESCTLRRALGPEQAPPSLAQLAFRPAPEALTARGLILASCLFAGAVAAWWVRRFREYHRDLMRAEHRLELALELADLAIWESDPRDGRTIAQSRCGRLLGLPEDPHGQMDRVLAARADRQEYAKAEATVDACRQGSDHAPYCDYSISRPDGTRRWIRDRCQVVERTDAGDAARVLRTFEDVTQQREDEEERLRLTLAAEQAQRVDSLGMLAGGIAHDSNNLLVPILGNADLALADLPPDSPARVSVAEIEKASRRAAELCRQMLDYAGKGRSVVAPLNLSAIVDEMSSMLEASISKKCTLVRRLPTDLPATEGDATQIRQVAMNLIINAAEAIGDRSGVISVSTGAMECDRAYLLGTYLAEDLPEGGYVYIEVTDTGEGMSKETQARLFEPFFTTKFAGRGLGLAAVLGIVRGHRGAIRFDSEFGRGSVFRVLFPACVRTAGVHPQAAETTTWQGCGTILVVDDEDCVRDVARRMLERGGFRVLAAADGREALACYRQHRAEIVCVLLDVAMPYMDGQETLRELRRANADIRIIMSSGYGDQEVVKRLAGEGLGDFIHKPYVSASLLAKVREVIEAPPKLQ